MLVRSTVYAAEGIMRMSSAEVALCDIEVKYLIFKTSFLLLPAAFINIKHRRVHLRASSRITVASVHI